MIKEALCKKCSEVGVTGVRSAIVKIIAKYGNDAGAHVYEYVKFMVDGMCV